MLQKYDNFMLRTIRPYRLIGEYKITQFQISRMQTQWQFISKQVNLLCAKYGLRLSPEHPHLGRSYYYITCKTAGPPKVNHDCMDPEIVETTLIVSNFRFEC